MRFYPTLHYDKHLKEQVIQQPPERVTNLRPERWNWVPDNTISPKEAAVSGAYVMFHKDYSHGTAAIRGDRRLDANVIAYWEITICGGLFGTSVMFGVGTNLAKRILHYRFTNLLGIDEQSYGLSYTGQIFHNGISVQFCKSLEFARKISILFHGPSASIAFFKDGVPLGWAFTQIDLSEPLYPMISSTAQQTSFTVSGQWSRTVIPESLSDMCLDEIAATIEDGQCIQRLPLPNSFKLALKRRFDVPKLFLLIPPNYGEQNSNCKSDW